MAISLKQLISIERNRINVLAGDDIDISARIDSNGALIESNRQNLETLTSTASGTQSALEAATSGFTDALTAEATARASGDLEEKTRAEGAESLLAGGIQDERARAILVEGALQAAVDAEADARIQADNGVIQAVLTEQERAALAEVTEFNRASAAEGVLQANIDTERTDRQTAVSDSQAYSVRYADDRGVIALTCEAEGLLSLGDFPFACGFGSQMTATFGMPIPFGCTVVHAGVTCSSTDSARDVQFHIEHFDGGANPTPIYTLRIAGASSSYAEGLPEILLPRGDIIVSVGATAGLSDVNARYRLTVYVRRIAAVV